MKMLQDPNFTLPGAVPTALARVQSDQLQSMGAPLYNNGTCSLPLFSALLSSALLSSFSSLLLSSPSPPKRGVCRFRIGS